MTDIDALARDLLYACEVVTTGTLTDAWPMAPGMRFEARLSDARLCALKLECSPS